MWIFSHCSLCVSFYLSRSIWSNLEPCASSKKRNRSSCFNGNWVVVFLWIVLSWHRCTATKEHRPKRKRDKRKTGQSDPGTHYVSRATNVSPSPPLSPTRRTTDGRTTRPLRITILIHIKTQLSFVGLPNHCRQTFPVRQTSNFLVPYTTIARWLCGCRLFASPSGRSDIHLSGPRPKRRCRFMPPLSPPKALATSESFALTIFAFA